MHICHIIDSLSAGGAENMVVNITRETGSDITHSVLYLQPPDTLREELESIGVNVISLNDKKLTNPAKFTTLCHELSNNSFDIVHTHLPASTIYGRIVGRLAGVPHLVSTQHNVANAYSKKSMFLEQITRPLDSRTIAVSNSVKKSMNPSIRDKISIIYNGVDINKFSGSKNQYLESKYNIGPNDTILLNVGRYVPQKSQSHIIDAMECIIDSNQDVHLFIVGWGELENKLRSHVDSLGLGEYVTITGFVDDVIQYYINSDIYISASEYEGLPVTVIEAMAAGLPVVGTNVSGTTEVVENESTGLLFEHGDVNQLTNATLILLDPDIRNAYSHQATVHARDNFSIDHTVTQHVQLYRELHEGIENLDIQ